jgi:hypothetical protein
LCFTIDGHLPVAWGWQIHLMQGAYQRKKKRFSRQTEKRAAQLLPDGFQRRANFARLNPIAGINGG